LSRRSSKFSKKKLKIVQIWFFYRQASQKSSFHPKKSISSYPLNIWLKNVTESQLQFIKKSKKILKH
jgi:hypothetical protein